MNLPPRTPPNPSTDGPKPKPPAARRPLFPGWVWWALFALLVLWNVFTFFAPSGETTVSLTYTDFPTPPPTSKSYSTVLPAQDDPSLMPLLEEKGVQVTNVDVSGGSWVLTLITSALPILLLVGLLLYLGRQMRRGSRPRLALVGVVPGCMKPSDLGSPSSMWPARTRRRPSSRRWLTS